MSVESEILRIQRNVADTYATVAEKGGTVPLQPNSENLPAAVSSIPAGGSVGGGVPKGSIIIWSGSASDIPDGWALCDGQDGRPDLRDKFVLGAGLNHSVGEIGGSETVTLTEGQMPAHRHGIGTRETALGSNAVVPTGSGSASTHTFVRSDVSGEGKPHPNMPPFYALCYIIKVTDGGSGGGGSSEEVYSTDEKRIGTWIDGKILYQKGAFISNFDVKKETTYNLGDYELPAFDIIDKLIAVKGSAKRKASSGYSALLPISGPNFDILISKTRNDWVLNSYGYEGTFDFDINVEYTKITDQPTVSADMPSMPIISSNN